MTSSSSLVLLALLSCLAQAGQGQKIPSPKSLCGLVVDTKVEQECLQCFSKAGEVAVNPDGVRKCVGTYLPPKVADCSVPHVDNRGGWRINQGPPPVHHNHTNANVLPSCLTRRMRELSRYLVKEMRFTRQAGHILKQVVVSKLVKDGGPTMLSIGAMEAILALPAVKSVVEGSPASKACLTRYPATTTRHLNHFIQTKALLALLEAEENNYDEENEEYKEEYEEDIDEEEVEAEEVYLENNYMSERIYYRTQAAGNMLPFGGTNSLARASLLGTCIISALVESGRAEKLLEIVTKDTFFYPIPQWWVESLLRLAKKLTMKLMT